jgi:hypothetical protein
MCYNGANLRIPFLIVSALVMTCRPAVLLTRPPANSPRSLFRALSQERKPYLLFFQPLAHSCSKTLGIHTTALFNFRRFRPLHGSRTTLHGQRAPKSFIGNTYKKPGGGDHCQFDAVSPLTLSLSFAILIRPHETISYRSRRRLGHSR